MSAEKLEVWLRGPLKDGTPPLLQPVAHALLQAREEVLELLADFPEPRLDARPAGLASVRFHLQHLTGVLDRLTTYALSEGLSNVQLEALAHEGQAGESLAELLRAFSEQLERTLSQLRETDPETLLEPRKVGRAGLPSTHLGLLVHAAEHTTRHVGQLLVTARVVRGS
jgi:uncharacterized damage-inducible protein DinB